MRHPQKMIRMRKKDGGDGSAGMCHSEHKIADAHKLIQGGDCNSCLPL